VRVDSKIRIRLRGGIVLEKGENVIAEPVAPEVQRALEKLRKGRVLTFEVDASPAAPPATTEPSQATDEAATKDEHPDEIVSREETIPLDLSPEPATGPAAAELAKAKPASKALRRRSE
jgi:hypothetical protein